MSSLKRTIATKERVARNLREWRLKRAMTQEQLSLGAGITQTFLSQVESGRRNVSIDTLEKLAVVLEIDIVELLLP